MYRQIEGAMLPKNNREDLLLSLKQDYVYVILIALRLFASGGLEQDALRLEPVRKGDARKLNMQEV